MIPSYNFVVANAYIERFWIVELNYFISWDFDSSADDFLNKSILNIWIFCYRDFKLSLNDRWSFIFILDFGKMIIKIL